MQLSIEEVKKLDSNSYQIIDIRSEEEVAHGAIKGALNIQAEEIEADERVSHDKKLVIVCSRGKTSVDVAQIKKLGREVKGYDENFWNGVRQIVVYEGLLAKFSQNHDLKEKLIETDNAILVECAVKDQIWGIGLSMKDENRFNRSKWRGQNLLGYALMMVRDQL